MRPKDLQEPTGENLTDPKLRWLSVIRQECRSAAPRILVGALGPPHTDGTSAKVLHEKRLHHFIRHKA
jgi:hypothetical protein